MDMQVSQVDTIAIMKLTGRFDAYVAPLLEGWLKKVAAHSPANAIINLEGVNFVDSTGLATLVQGMKHCRQQNGNLYLCCLQQPVRIIVELTRFDRVFDIFNTQDEAIESFLSLHLNTVHSLHTVEPRG